MDPDHLPNPPGKPSRCRTRCFSIPPRIWRKVFHQSSAEPTSHWTLHLDLDSLFRAWGGPFLEVSFRASPDRFDPPTDTSRCDTLRHDEHLLVGNLGILLENRSEDSATVFALDLAGGAPRDRVEIFALSEDGSILDRRRTDSSGTARIRVTKATRVVAKTPTEQAWLRPRWMDSPWGGSALGGTARGPRIGAPPGERILPFLAKQVHRPGEELVASCLVRVPGATRVSGKVRVRVEDCALTDSAILDIPPDGLVQWRFRANSGKRRSTCWGKLVWNYGNARAISRFSVEEPWRPRPDTANPARMDHCDPHPAVWSEDSLSSLPSLAEGDTLAWDESSTAEGIALVQATQGRRILRRFWQPMRPGSNRLRMVVDSSWDPHVLVTRTEIGRRSPTDTAWHLRRPSREFHIHRTLRELPIGLEASPSPDGSVLRIRVRNPSSRHGSISLWVLDTATSGLDAPEPDIFPTFQHMPEIVAQQWSDGLGETRLPYLDRTGPDCDPRSGRKGIQNGGFPRFVGTGTPGSNGCAHGYGPMAPILSVRPVSAPFSWISAPVPFGPDGLEMTIPLAGHRGPWVVGAVGASGGLFGRARIVVDRHSDSIRRLPLP
ncbi:MAG TPA: hypothetical protein PKY05_00685 [Fibrobacteria bacterium]|nr:hypothetical protein [Fibrobacteria bacterium]